MKLKKFKEKDNKRTGIIIFTITCILLVSGVILYRTFAVFEVKTNQNVINGTIQDPGNLYFAFYQMNEESGEYVIQKEMPNLEEGYVLDEVQSYCGVGGEKDTDIEVYLSEDGYIKVKGMKTSRTKCNLYFAKGIFIQGKGIPIVKNGDGLYVVEHSASETVEMDAGWQTKEYRYAGKNPNNYVWFNDELWRIIGLVNVKTSSGQIEQRLKIVRQDSSIGNYAWDTYENGYTNDWTKASLMTELNENYYQNTLTNTASKSMIAEDNRWNLGIPLTSYQDVTVNMFYESERGETVDDNRSATWPAEDDYSTTARIGLIYASDYGYASSGGSLGRSDCFKRELYNWNQEEQCSANDWLKPSSISTWTLSLYEDDTAFLVNYAGTVTWAGVYHDTLSVHPVVYLKPSVQIIFGTGTSNDAFILKEI